MPLNVAWGTIISGVLYEWNLTEWPLNIREHSYVLIKWKIDAETYRSKSIHASVCINMLFYNSEMSKKSI